MTAAMTTTLALCEPYEAHKANALRRECYRRGVPPVKAGPGMNNHKAGFVALLRAFDCKISATCPDNDDEATALALASASTVSSAASSAVASEEPLAKRRKRMSTRIQAEAASNSTASAAAAVAVVAAADDSAPPSQLASKLQLTAPPPQDEATATAANTSNAQAPQEPQAQHARTKSTTQMTPVERAKTALFESQRTMLERQQLAAEHRDLIVSVTQVQAAIARIKVTERNSVAAAAVLADLELDLEFMLRQKRLIRAHLDAYFDSANTRKRVACV